jgi:hypothetical protein
VTPVVGTVRFCDIGREVTRPLASSEVAEAKTRHTQAKMEVVRDTNIPGRAFATLMPFEAPA